MPRTIPRTATKKIAAIAADFTACRMYDDSTGNFVPMDPTRAWKALDQQKSARLIVNDAGDKYTISVHSNLWFELTRPAPAEQPTEPEAQPAPVVAVDPATEPPTTVVLGITDGTLHVAEQPQRRTPADLTPMRNRKLADPADVAAIHAARCPDCHGAGCAECAFSGQKDHRADHNPTDPLTDWWEITGPNPATRYAHVHGRTLLHRDAAMRRTFYDVPSIRPIFDQLKAARLRLSELTIPEMAEMVVAREAGHRATDAFLIDAGNGARRAIQWRAERSQAMRDLSTMELADLNGDEGTDVELQRVFVALLDRVQMAAGIVRTLGSFPYVVKLHEAVTAARLDCRRSLDDGGGRFYGWIQQAFLSAGIELPDGEEVHQVCRWFLKLTAEWPELAPNVQTTEAIADVVRARKLGRPALPDDVAFYLRMTPVYQHATVAYARCHTCGDTGPYVTGDHNLGAAAGDWHTEHQRTTGHRSFEHWQLSRSEMRVFRL